MRLFKVDGVWPEGERSTVVLDEQCIRVTHGDEGPGVYIKDHVILVEPVLAEFFKEGIPYLPLPAARISTDPSKPVSFLRDSRSNIDRINNGSYYGECIVQVSFLEGTHELYASSFKEVVADGPFGGRVVREYERESAGMEVLAASDDGQEMLIKLVPGASFRLHRKLKGKESLVVISWSGRHLKSFSPPFREAREPREGKKRNRRRRDRAHQGAPSSTTRYRVARESKDDESLTATMSEVINLATRRQG